MQFFGWKVRQIKLTVLCATFMEKGEIERLFDHIPISPLPYMIEPVSSREVKVRVKEEKAKVFQEEVPTVHQSLERVGNTTWCLCGCCTATLTASESICSQGADVDHLLGDLPSISPVHSTGRDPEATHKWQLG